MSKLNLVELMNREFEAERLYYTRDLYRWYGFENYGVALPKDLMYIVTGENSGILSRHETETGAVKNAEALAALYPGSAYYVSRRVTKSYVAPAPTITTRL